jgi:hypothetical protein
MPRTRGSPAIAGLLAAALGCASGATLPGTVPANALVPPVPSTSSPATRSQAREKSAPLQNLVCDPGETETCVCADESTGSRRCNASGNAFSPCDACPKPQLCGQLSCEAFRIDLIALTLPGCCPTGSASQCGVDATFVAKNYGLSLGCLEFDAPGTPDAACPSVDVPLPERGTTTLAGCRTPAGRCGYEVDVPDVIDLGCVEVR